MHVKTNPRPLVAEFVRFGDEIAVYPVPARHKPAEPCDCESTDGESRQQHHCATRHLPVRGLTFLEHNAEAVLWCRVVKPPVAAPAENLWFGTPRLSITVLPYAPDGYPLPLARFVADQRDPMVVRERVRVPETNDGQREGQPEIPAGITRAPLRLVPAADASTVDSDATQVLACSRVPVGVQTIELTGAVRTRGYEHQHEDTSATLDFASERESGN